MVFSDVYIKLLLKEREDWVRCYILTLTPFFSNGATQEGEAEAAPVVAMEKCQVAEETVVEVNTEAVNTEQTSDEVKPAQPSETPDGPNPELQPGKNWTSFHFTGF